MKSPLRVALTKVKVLPNELTREWSYPIRPSDSEHRDGPQNLRAQSDLEQ